MAAIACARTSGKGKALDKWTQVRREVWRKRAPILISRVRIVSMEACSKAVPARAPRKARGRLYAQAMRTSGKGMRNIRLLIEYDGTPFAGWQRQRTGLAVQEVLEAALREVTGEAVSVVGAGRTDAGVHALGQVANFRTASPIPARGLVAAVNRLLPETIVVRRAEEVAPDFHARFSAVAKRYRYTFLRQWQRSALAPRRGYVVRGPLDAERMRRAARLFMGRHDFSAFEARHHQRKGDARRTIFAAELIEQWPRLIFEVEADGFLYKMVRTMAGTLLEVGRGRRSLTDVRRALVGGRRAAAGPTAPPYGLCLLWVKY